MFALYDLCHPSYYKISQLGCTDGIRISVAFYVYMELCEVKCLRHVVYKYNKETDIIYLEGKKSENSESETYVSWPSIYKISLVQIESIQEHLNLESFTFAFRGGDSTTVYYNVSSGLIKPISPEETKLIKQKEENKFKLYQEIRKNTTILYEIAKSLDTEEKVINIESTNSNTTIDNEKPVPVLGEKIEEIQLEKKEVTTDKKSQYTKNTKSSQPTIKSVEIISPNKEKLQ